MSLIRHSAKHLVSRGPADNLDQQFFIWGQNHRCPGAEETHPRFSPLCLQAAPTVKGRLTSEATKDKASI